MKTSMTIERLRQVVRVLEELPGWATFDLAGWSCGTTACAAGWAAQDSWFTQRSLTLNHAGRPIFGRHYAFGAVEKFFGLNPYQSTHLFSSISYKRGSKYDVIRRINAFCNNLEKVSA